MAASPTTVTVLGAGIVGLAVADELLRRGHRVSVVDPSPGQGASYAAAGMLSPAGEAWHGEEELFRLGAASLGLWPEFAARLGVPLHTRGTLLAGADAGDVQLVERQLAVLDRAGVAYQRLGRRELLAHEPGLGRVAGGALLPDDHSVDPRAVVAALRDSVGRAAGGHFVRTVAEACRDQHREFEEGRVGLDTDSLVPHESGSTDGGAESGSTDGGAEFGSTDGGAESGSTDGGHESGSTDGGAGSTDGGDESASTDGGAEVTVIATGAHLPEPYTHLSRPVRGDVLRVRTDDPLEHTVRAWVHGEQVYVVPRSPVDGTAEMVVGATSEERDGPLLPTAEAVWRLLDAARRVVPALDRAHLVEATARDRPGTPDNHPLVGPTDQPGVLLAAGTYRNGVLLAPLVARMIADHLDDGSVDPATDPRRFTDPTPQED